MAREPGGILMAVPPEIRSEIYRLLLIRKEPIPISTPRRRTFKELLFSDARGSILYVNKQIHSEAIRIFFEYNTFIVGNGTGVDEASFLGLKAFVTYIPAAIIASISHIHFHIYLRMKAQSRTGNNNISNARPPLPVQSSLYSLDTEETPFNSGDGYSLGSPAEALEIRQISRRIPKHFTGLHRVTVDWIASDVQIWPGRILPQAPTITVLSNAITSLMSLSKIQRVCIWEDECIHIEQVLDRVMAEGETTGKIIDFQQPRYAEGVSGRLRDGNKVQREIHIWWRDKRAWDSLAKMFPRND